MTEGGRGTERLRTCARLPSIIWSSRCLVPKQDRRKLHREDLMMQMMPPSRYAIAYIISVHLKKRSSWECECGWVIPGSGDEGYELWRLHVADEILASW